MNKQRFPRIRFDGFLGDWEKKTLADVSIVERGKFSARPRNDPKFFGGSMPFIQTGDITNSDLFLTNYTQTLNSDGILVSKVFPQKTILITIAANIGDTAITTFDIACPDSVVAIRADENRSNVFFLKYILDLKRAFLNDCATQNAQKNINLQVLNPLEIKLCSLAEQTHLGLFFRRLDSQITESRAVLEKSRQLKKAMLAKMFPANGEKIPKIRFKGFEGEWEEKGFKSVGEFNPKTEIPKIFQYVDLESVVGTQLISYREEFRETAPSRAQRLAKNGDLFFQAVRPYQKNNYLFEKNNGNFVFSTGYIQIRPQNDGYFLLTLVQKEEFVQEVLLRCTGTSYPAINASSLQDIAILIPQTSKEQTAIGNFFRQLDETIALQSAEVEKLNQLKKGLLAAMLV